MYTALVAAFNQSEDSNVTDLRTDVYPDSLTYPPDQVFTIINGLSQPSDLGTCQPSDWTAVYDQIKTEVKTLQDLYNFQTSFQVGTLATADAMNDSFQTAINTLNDNSTNGVVSILEIVNAICSAGSAVFEGPAAMFTIMGAYAEVASTVAGAVGVSGDMSSLQTQLSSVIDQMNTQAGNLYAPICLDWGRLQQFSALLPSIQSESTQADYNLIGNEYEIGIYQSVCPSSMAVVTFGGVNDLWGSCASSSNPNTGFAYIPEATGQSGCNGTLCSRLATLGVSLDDVINRSGGWSGLATWECFSTREGSHCRQTS
jgi:hypothetical protein